MTLNLLLSPGLGSAAAAASGLGPSARAGCASAELINNALSVVYRFEIAMRATCDISAVLASTEPAKCLT